MKLLYVFPEELCGRFAREYHVYRLAESLAAAGGEVTLVAAGSPGEGELSRLRELFGGSGHARLRVVWIPRQMGVGPWKIRSGAWFFHRLERLLPELKPEVVLTMHVKAADYFSKRHAALPLVFEAHEIFADNYAEAEAKHGRLLETERRIYGHACGVVAISDFLAKSLRERFDLRVPVRVQHDGIDEGMLLEGTAEAEARELIYVGSLQAWKGVPVALAAMRLLPEFHLTVIGGEGKALDSLRREAPGNVTFLGQMSREALRPFLRKARVGLMPNLLEPRNALYTFPLKLLEYSAAGKGIVASRIPAFEGLEVEAWTTLVPSGSAEALAEGVRARVAAGIDAAAAREWAGRFVWEKQGAALKGFLDSLFT